MKMSEDRKSFAKNVFFFYVAREQESAWCQNGILLLIILLHPKEIH